jgi:hypothetical protein
VVEPEVVAEVAQEEQVTLLQLVLLKGIMVEMPQQQTTL